MKIGMDVGMALGMLGDVSVAAIAKPDEIFSTNLKVWLKSDAGIYQDAGATTPSVLGDDPVQLWQDQSGNNNHFPLAATAGNPLLKKSVVGGKDGIYFPATAGLLNTTITGASGIPQPFTVFTVCRVANTADSKYVYLGVGAGFASALYIDDSEKPRLSSGTEVIGAGVFSTGANLLIRCEHNAASSQVVSNATVVLAAGSTIGTGGIKVPYLGNRASLTKGYLENIAEFIIVTGIPSAAQITQMQAYITERYSINFS